MSKYRSALNKTTKSFGSFLPIILSTILIIGLFLELFDKNTYAKIFTGNDIFDSIIGAIFGSIAAGSPVVSYVIGGELLGEGISLIAIVAFILTWVTVGIVQLPAEIDQLGPKFSLLRNIISFLSAVVIAIIISILITYL